MFKRDPESGSFVNKKKEIGRKREEGEERKSSSPKILLYLIAENIVGKLPVKSTRIVRRFVAEKGI